VSHIAVRPLGGVLPIDAVVAHSAQAVCEALVLNNLGLDAPTTAGQAILFCAMLAGLWAWTRRRRAADGTRTWPRLNALEAAGGTLVLATFGLIFAGRGMESDFESLRGLGWYDAMAELGAVLFVAGWCAGGLPSPPPRAIEAPGRRGLLVVVLFALVLLALQTPRAHRVIFEYDQMAAPVGPDSPRTVPRRTPADLAAQARDQRRALAALDRIERDARRGTMDRAEVRRAIERAAIPAMPSPQPDFDPADMLDLPGGSANLHGPENDRR
jgi:hypothetical protein